MPKDLILKKNDATGEFELTPINANQDIEGARETKDLENPKLCSQVGKTLLSATQWTAWWVGAFATNVALCAAPGAILGLLGGFCYARLNEPCIDEKNSIAVNKCASRSPEMAQGALYGSSTALIGAAVTTVGFFKNPTVEGAKITMFASAVAVGYCCAAMCKGLSSD